MPFIQLMERTLKLNLNNLIFALLMSGCATTSSYKDQEVVVSQRVRARLSDGSEKTIEKGEVFILNNSPILIEAPGHVGMLLAPVNSTAGRTTVSLKPVSTWSGEAIQSYSNKVLSEILEEVQHVQVEMANKENAKALKMVQNLRARYPKISYLKILEASCYVLMGKSQEAEALLLSALEEFPTPRVIEFYETLTGKKYTLREVDKGKSSELSTSANEQQSNTEEKKL